MEIPGHAEPAERQHAFWRWLVIHVAVAFLVVSLTGRFLQASGFETTSTAQSNSPKAKTQHLADDACGWTVPVTTVTPDSTVPSARRIELQEDALRSFQFDGTVSDRAPPIS